MCLNLINSSIIFLDHVRAKENKNAENLSFVKKVPPNLMEDSVQLRRILREVIVMLYPFAPHFASELWSGAMSVPVMAEEANRRPLWEMDWPVVDPNVSLDLVVQVGPGVNDSMSFSRCDTVCFLSHRLMLQFYGEKVTVIRIPPVRNWFIKFFLSS